MWRPSRNPTHVSQKTTHTHDGCSQCVRARLCARVCVVWVRLHHTTKSLAPQSNPGMSASSPCPCACMANHLAVAPRGGLVARGQVVVPRVAHHVVQLELVGGEAAARASHARRTVGIRMTLLTTERLLLLWHCGAHTAEPNIGVIRPIPPISYHQNLLFSVARGGTRERNPLQPRKSREDATNRRKCSGSTGILVLPVVEGKVAAGVGLRAGGVREQ